MRLRVPRDGVDMRKAAKLLRRSRAQPNPGRRQRWNEPVRPTSNEKGEMLERRVAALFERLGWKVERNVIIKDTAGRASEIDIIARSRLPFRRPMYIECKNYAKPLPLHSVAKFKEVLVQNSLPISRGLLVTTATLTPRVRAAGIAVWDGAELVAAETRADTARRIRLALKLGAAAVLVYATAVASSPALAALEERGLAPGVLTSPIGGDKAANAGTLMSLSLLELLSEHRRWWGRAGAALAGSAPVQAAAASLPKDAQRVFEDVKEGVGFLRLRIARLFGGGEGPTDDENSA